MKKSIRCVLLLGFLRLCLGVTVTSGSWEPAALAPVEHDTEAAIEVDADSMQYDRTEGRIIADGNVVIVSGNDRLRGDRVLVNVNTGDLYALGNVELERDGEVLRAERLHYNTRTRISSLDSPEIDSDPFVIASEELTRMDDGTIELEGARLTTCERGHDHPHYHVRARRLTVYPGDHIRANHAVWYFGRVPLFYVPHWRRRLHDEYGWNLHPGYRSRWGTYLLASYFHRITPHIRLEHHVDLYERRGVGLGEDIDWRFDGGEGQLSLYYIRDRKPLGRTPPEPPPDVDKERYRIFLRHNQRLDDNTRLFIQNEYVSDVRFRRDFFDRQYRRLRQPENFASISHQRDIYTITALANYRLNDFYGNVNRLPEVSLDWYRMQLGDTTLYYESENAAAFLERVYPKGDERDSHSTLRVDAKHSVYQPRQFWGWLNVVPRSQYRGTYYSNSRKVETEEIISTQNITNDFGAVVGTVDETNTVTRVVDGSAQLRHVVELGSELSFKAFRRLPDSPGGQPWRHVVEPYANYTLRFEPNVLPEDLYQYDAVDRISDRHVMLLGVRNLLQTKWDDRSVEAADVNLFTTANLDTGRDEKNFETVHMESRFRPVQWATLDFDSVYDLVESEVAEFRARMRLRPQNLYGDIGRGEPVYSPDQWSFDFEHRYRRERSNLASINTTFSPNRDWTINLHSRYEFEDSRLEEQGGFLQRNFDCMSVRLGGSVMPSYRRSDGTREEVDYRVELAFWLTAFPQMGSRAR